jgi:hypothetical protein
MDDRGHIELAAGPDQTIVVYRPTDLGSEVEPISIFSAIAADAEARAARGEWIVTMAVMPLRHAGALFSEASGYQTKTAVAVVYGRVGKGAATPDR